VHGELFLFVEVIDYKVSGAPPSFYSTLYEETIPPSARLFLRNSDDFKKLDFDYKIKIWI